MPAARSTATVDRYFHYRVIVSLLPSLLLTGCGGSGSGSGDGAATAAGVAAAASAPASAASAPVQLAGVAAFGAPLTGADIKVIDAKGVAVGSGVTNQADGSYSLTLTSATPAWPLLVQADGFDATGQPLLLHAAVSALPTTATAAATGTTTTTGTTTAAPTATAAVSATPSLVLNITPLTDAVVALTLGTEPRKVFAQPASYATAWAGLAKLAPAADFVKTLVKTNLSDAKVTNTATLDLFADGSFAATKSGVDLALETLSVSYGSSAARRDQLQLSNKLGSKLVEVTVDLASAAAELAKATGAAPATAITSTSKATTSPTALITRLAALDTLGVALNTAIAAGGSGSGVTALTSSYVRHNGRDAGALTALIASWAQQGTQLGRLQVTGCADLPSTGTSTTTTTTTTTTGTTATSCTRVAIAARLTDTAGREAGSFSDAVSYGTGTSKWSLVGNGLPTEVSARAIAWLSLNADGGKASVAAGNPRTGIQLGVQNTAASASVLTPSNYVLSLVPCAQAWLCINPTASSTGASSVLASATPTDQSVFQGSSAWMGIADTSLGASYGFTLTPTTTGTSGSTAQTLPALLRSGFLDAPADARFAVLDGVKTGDPISGATLLFGTPLAWQTWAAANPDMRVTRVRLVLASNNADSAPLVFEATPARWRASGLDWPAVALPDHFVLGGVTLSLRAIDSNGRGYDTSYVVVAP